MSYYYRLSKHFIKLKFALIFLFTFFSTFSFAQSWLQLDDFPATQRDDGTAFVIGNMGYCGTGYKAGYVETRDFYSFDMNSDTWATIASLPAGEERQYASGFSSDTHGFLFGGVNDGVWLNDMWMYDPLQNIWVEKSSLPDVGRSGAACFVIDNIAYIIGGKTLQSSAINEVFAYDIATDTWQQKGNLPFGMRFRGSAASKNNKGYLIFGKDENNQFYNDFHEYDPVLDSWTELSAFPGLGRSHSSLSAVSNNLVLIGGIDSTGFYYNDMWRFNLDLLTWEELDSLPALGRKGGMYFTNGSNVYYTTGINQINGHLKDTWKSVNPTALEELNYGAEIRLYPNPVLESLNLELTDFNPGQHYSVTIIDYTGKQILTKAISEKRSTIDFSKVSKGLYFLRIQSKDRFRVEKLIKL